MREFGRWKITTPNETEEMTGVPWEEAREELRFCAMCSKEFKQDGDVYWPNFHFREWTRAEMNLIKEEWNCEYPFADFYICKDCSLKLEKRLTDLIELPESLKKNRLNLYVPDDSEALFMSLKEINPDRSWSELVMEAIGFYVNQHVNKERKN